MARSLPFRPPIAYRACAEQLILWKAIIQGQGSLRRGMWSSRTKGANLPAFAPVERARRSIADFGVGLRQPLGASAQLQAVNFHPRGVGKGAEPSEAARKAKKHTRRWLPTAPNQASGARKVRLARFRETICIQPATLHRSDSSWAESAGQSETLRGGAQAANKSGEAGRRGLLSCSSLLLLRTAHFPTDARLAR